MGRLPSCPRTPYVRLRTDSGRPQELQCRVDAARKRRAAVRDERCLL